MYEFGKSEKIWYNESNDYSYEDDDNLGSLR